MSYYLGLNESVFQNIPQEPKPIKRLIPKTTNAIFAHFNFLIINKTIPAKKTKNEIKQQKKNNVK